MYDTLSELSDKNWYSTKFFENKWKKLLTNGFDSDIVNKLSRTTADENLDNWTVKHIYNPRKFFERDSLERQAHSKNDRKIL